MNRFKKSKALLVAVSLALVLTLLPRTATASSPEETLNQQKALCLVLIYGAAVPDELSASDEASIIGCMLSHSTSN